MNRGIGIIMVYLSAIAGDAWAEVWADPDKVAAVQQGMVKEANVEWWGFDEEDSTKYLQAALDSGASRVIVPRKGSPWVVEPLHVNVDNLEVLFEPGVVLEAKWGAFRERNDSLLSINGRKNIRLIGYGAEFRMHKEDYWNPPYRRSEWRHALSVRGTVGLHIEGITFYNSGGDGIYLSTTPEVPYVKDVVIRAVVCDANNRQGISVISADNLLIEKSVFRNTIGTSPMAGIDLEPNRSDQLMRDVVIRNNLFINNSQIGMHMWFSNLTSESAPVSITIENNTIIGGDIGIHLGRFPDNGPGGYVYINNNLVQDTHFAGILIRRLSASSGIDIQFNGNVLYNTANHGEYAEEVVEVYQQLFNLESPALWWGSTECPSAPIVMTAQVHTPSKQGGVRFNGDVIFHDGDTPAVVIGGPWGREWQERFANEKEEAKDGEFVAWEGIKGNIQVIGPGVGERVKVAAPTNGFELEITGKQ